MTTFTGLESGEYCSGIPPVPGTERSSQATFVCGNQVVITVYLTVINGEIPVMFPSFAGVWPWSAAGKAIDGTCGP